jgi:CO/xanthine dehydrogenase Mo-binding subunit
MHNVTSISRRGILKAGGALIIGFTFSSVLPKQALAQNAPPPQFDVDSFLAIHEDGTVTILTSHVDVGTGISTALRQALHAD